MPNGTTKNQQKNRSLREHVNFADIGEGADQVDDAADQHREQNVEHADAGTVGETAVVQSIQGGVVYYHEVAGTNTSDTGTGGTDADDTDADDTGREIAVVEPSEDLYIAAVAEARQILADVDTIRQMRIGELADQVAKVYRENRLKKFADAIGIAECTVGRYRSVYRAWRTTDNKSAPEPICYSVAKALQTVPNRFDLIRQNRNVRRKTSSASTPPS
jgi:hypothetical protein